MCMRHKKCSFQIRFIKKACTFFNNCCKKSVFITECFEENCLEVQKIVNYKYYINNGPPLRCLKIAFLKSL